MSKLTTIEGIGPALAARLEGVGIRSTGALLKKGATAAGRREIAEQAAIDPERVLKFVNHADLMRVKGVGGEYSELLEAAGVDSVPELAVRNATNLAAKMAEVNMTRKLVRSVPSAAMVTGWVDQAKNLDRIITH